MYKLKNFRKLKVTKWTREWNSNLKHFPVARVFKEDGPVEDAEEGIADDEEQDVVPDQLEDAALPYEQEVPEAIQPFGRRKVPNNISHCKLL